MKLLDGEIKRKSVIKVGLARCDEEDYKHNSSFMSNEGAGWAPISAHTNDKQHATDASTDTHDGARNISPYGGNTPNIYSEYTSLTDISGY
jgi:hypothetical protein